MALVVGEVIGVGIFLTPAGLAKALGSPMWLLAVWLVMGGATLAGAFCLSELAARFPASGGSYIFLREAYGPETAFLFGWMSMLVLDPGITAALATGLASYVSYIIPLSDFGRTGVAVGVVLALAAINIVGVRLGAGLLRWMTVLKVSLLLLIVCWGFGSSRGEHAGCPGEDVRQDAPQPCGPFGLCLSAELIPVFMCTQEGLLNGIRRVQFGAKLVVQMQSRQD